MSRKNISSRYVADRSRLHRLEPKVDIRDEMAKMKKMLMGKARAIGTKLQNKKRKFADTEISKPSEDKDTKKGYAIGDGQPTKKQMQSTSSELSVEGKELFLANYPTRTTAPTERKNYSQSAKTRNRMLNVHPQNNILTRISQQRNAADWETSQGPRRSNPMSAPAKYRRLARPDQEMRSYDDAQRFRQSSQPAMHPQNRGVQASNRLMYMDYGGMQQQPLVGGPPSGMLATSSNQIYEPQRYQMRMPLRNQQLGQRRATMPPSPGQAMTRMPQPAAAAQPLTQAAPVAQPVAQPVGQPFSQQVSQPAARPVAQPVVPLSQFKSQPVPESLAQPMAQSRSMPMAPVVQHAIPHTMPQSKSPVMPQQTLSPWMQMRGLHQRTPNQMLMNMSSQQMPVMTNQMPHPIVNATPNQMVPMHNQMGQSRMQMQNGMQMGPLEMNPMQGQMQGQLTNQQTGQRGLWRVHEDIMTFEGAIPQLQQQMEEVKKHFSTANVPELQQRVQTLQRSFDTLLENQKRLVQVSAIAQSRTSGVSCHQCKKSNKHINFCTNVNTGNTGRSKKPCRKKYCTRCLTKFYNDLPLPHKNSEWACPACRGTCSCASCMRQRNGKASQR